ncbi:ribosome maturation factor RimM [Rhodospirillum rubrum]|uniref:Ribosome maturation factor RimM n=1 Tax=Rhodospirillum rubrum (strain ATCC 11170 / ATH 1.1.1 / DSM 467 / LMG 4362 / NCIMB 8255 / S1) TaxID=269796 RepID=RIMM_RHORT|nr:ribosome maturation factor RimM [Rhodospirillum rubrum]Q2RV58.1 RecName: Full=Ribosome maturation factor RimM [Rhodospirillum rubrum ATCC 11170]ABC21987.1 16S rRNA processing protein RimM [Rhodospirillum rubrum ATCC 11170]AEO47699.1 16S rRNA processing protein RimM [Rhodospirillum rubrum F11]MBK5953568.1 ribosome maturation factor RimM [Rhodospirillum rubrum]QXG81643.1 ribosome maturation factor RimM [Rhodospirillum rubrum]HAP99142.1 ribosome maturation factor RimM [Rhodospirillum rubrum]
MTERLLVGVIVGSHGVRGLVRVKSFTQDEMALCDYGPLSDETGTRRFAVEVRNQAKGVVICQIPGVSDRTAADALKGTRLFLDRAALPADALEEDEYYHADLIGLPVDLVDGGRLGVVHSVHDFGAGDMLEVTLAQGRRSVLLPFTKAVVPLVDVKAGRLVADPPLGLLDDTRPPAGVEGEVEEDPGVGIDEDGDGKGGAS